MTILFFECFKYELRIYNTYVRVLQNSYFCTMYIFRAIYYIVGKLLTIFQWIFFCHNRIKSITKHLHCHFHENKNLFLVIYECNLILVDLTMCVVYIIAENVNWIVFDTRVWLSNFKIILQWSCWCFIYLYDITSVLFNWLIYNLMSMKMIPFIFDVRKC